MMNYPFYSNNQFYLQDLQNMKERIDKQIQQIQQNQSQIQQQPSINQTFQLAPNQNNNNDLESKYAENINDVKNTFVVKTGLFITKDYSTLWIKNVNGDIKTFKTEEIIELDDKDKEILELKNQIKEMRGMILNASEFNNANVNEQVESTKPKTVSRNKSTNAK